jgi:hypothetical protein
LEIFCPQCRLQQPTTFRFCVRCGGLLPTSLLDSGASKVWRFFAGVKVGDGDPEDGYLRVSRYRRDVTIESREGSVVIPGEHVRFSIWSGEKALCVLSLPESEARELVSFLASELGAAEPSSVAQ